MHSNNAAELSGLIMAITQAKTIGLTDLCIYTDSTNNCLHRWAQYNFLDEDGLPRPNLTLWKKLNTVCENINLDLRWVKAHNKNKYNNMADELAKQGAEMCRVLVPTTSRQRL